MVSIIRNSAGILDVIQYPCMSLKAKDLNEKQSQIVVFVEIDATKIEIKKAVENIFGMKVKKINTMMLKGKNKISGRRHAYTEKRRKKAIISFVDKELAQKMSRADEDGLLVNSKVE